MEEMLRKPGVVAPGPSTRVERGAPGSTAVDSARADSTAVDSAVRGARETLRKLGIRATTAESWLRKGMEALRAAGKLSPEEDVLVDAALNAAGG